MSQQPIDTRQSYPENNSVVSHGEMMDTFTEQDSQPKPKNNIKNLIVGITIGIIGTIVAMKFIGANPNPTSESAATNPVSANQVSTKASQSVTTTQPQIISVASKIEATGTIVPFELIPVTSQANNLLIKEVLVDEGDIVSQGQVLIRLDDSVLRAELRQAQAAVKQAQARLAELKAGTRQEELARAEENINVIQSEILQSESDLQLAKTRLERNRQLEAEGAISKDSLDEFINAQQVQATNLQRNKARLREAQQRLLELQKGARQEVIDQAQAGLSEAQARVKLTEARLADTIIKAPASGKIAERNARVGDVTSSFSEEKFLTIIQDGRFELQVRVPEGELRKIKPQQKVKISSTANPNLNLTGIVRDINPIIDQDSRQGTVNVDLPVGNGLKTGMFVQASIITDTQPRLTVPMAAVVPQNNGQGTIYFIQPDNTVQARTVTLGDIVDNQAIEIVSGIELGETIALKGVNYLQDGVKVEIVEN